MSFSVTRPSSLPTISASWPPLSTSSSSSITSLPLFSHHPYPSRLDQTRFSCHASMSGPRPTDADAPKKVTISHLHGLRRKGVPIVGMTAHDFPSALVADRAGIDIILVGDSLAMVSMGMDDTSEIVLEEMIMHCRSVSRAAKSAFIIGDLTMGSYEISPQQALTSAIRLVKEGRVHGIKLEGGREMAPTIRAITTAGIPVFGHIGLTPQRANSLGGFRIQGKTRESAMSILRDALAIQEAGAFAMVLEAVPAEMAALITEKLRVPTVGIGAGAGCAGQIIVQVDATGNYPEDRFTPKFVKKYGNVWGEAQRAIEAYRDDVKSRSFPAEEHTLGANTLLTYKNTLSVSLHLSFLLKYRTTSSNLRTELILHTSWLSPGAAPTGLNRTTTLSWAKRPALASAAEASRGRSCSTTEADMVKGRSGESGLSSGKSSSMEDGRGESIVW
ncbi:3-methyl-2-oxobutanoate hydroxymethyltransferase, partial [Geosmithia morbida]